MSGHNKWSSIKHKKGAADAKRGAIFSRVSKEIIQAAREGGGDPDLNARLRAAIAAAKAANMPNDNIDRAIKKGTGALGGAAIEEFTYEGYAAGGVSVIVNCMSDNKNRCASDIRSFFTRHNCKLGGSGAVSYKFKRKSKFVIEGDWADEDKLTELMMEADAPVDDIQVDDGVAEIIAAPDGFAKILGIFEANGIVPTESTLAMIPDSTTMVSEINVAKSVQKFVDALEEYDDCQAVYHDMEISDEVAEALAAEEE
ncbi:MAG: YebC/PmpR family DNA-binding transcriptional regulator [Lentisphaeria bacterium]|nr:YebC/PmpR family DNA-binding transcriptional regulator [Lentisphaeria bacterium]